MRPNVHQVHKAVKPECAWPSMERGKFTAHHAHMRKRSPKPPRWRLTFLRQYREEAKLSLEDASALMGYKSHSTLQRAETGKIQYTQKLIENAARVYSRSALEILFVDPARTDDIAKILRAAESLEILKTELVQKRPA